MEIDKIKEILKESTGAPTAKMDMNLSKILMSMLDIIAQQDYIIIDWEGKDTSDDAKKAEVDAQLKNIYLANPLALLSVVFKDYVGMGYYFTTSSSFKSLDNNITFVILDPEDGGPIQYQFSIAD